LLPADQPALCDPLLSIHSQQPNRGPRRPAEGFNRIGQESEMITPVIAAGIEERYNLT